MGLSESRRAFFKDVDVSVGYASNDTSRMLGVNTIMEHSTVAFFVIMSFFFGCICGMWIAYELVGIGL
jgi:hypothetical protein